MASHVNTRGKYLQSSFLLICKTYMYKTCNSRILNQSKYFYSYLLTFYMSKAKLATFIVKKTQKQNKTKQTNKQTKTKTQQQ